MSADGAIPFHVSPGNGDSGGNFSEYRARWFMPVTMRTLCNRLKGCPRTLLRYTSAVPSRAAGTLLDVDVAVFANSDMLTSSLQAWMGHPAV